MSKEIIDFIIYVYTDKYKTFDELVKIAKDLNFDVMLVAYIINLRKRDKYPTLHDCIDLLKQEGSDTKQQVLEKLEELVK